MVQYLYYAKIRGEQIQFKSITALVHCLNSSYGYPILTNNKTYNYFLRPERMSSVLPHLEQFELQRQPVA